MADRRVRRVGLETPVGICVFDCGEDEHIWDVAAANGIALPAICHHGRCLTCAGRLLEGRVEHDHPDAYFPEDERGGYVLLCCAMPRGEVLIRTHEEWEMREHRLAHGLPAPYA
jgi:ferredoxin